jgi:hypothetical protein
MEKSTNKRTKQPDTSSTNIAPLSAKERAWVEMVYSDSIPLTLTWRGRVAEATRKTNYSPDEDRIRQMSRIYFQSHIRAEAYWSMVIMYHNVCDSIRTPEGAGDGKNNENSSYKVKIENGLKLKSLMKEMRDMAEDLFKKNEQAEADFQSGKMDSSFGEGVMEASLRELKDESKAS